MSDGMQDMRVTELLVSRICHDLISPVGAINNGVELLEEMGSQVGEEAIKLIGHSAAQASRRLRLFRLCYGAAGSDATLTGDDVLATAKDYVEGGKVSLMWDPAALKALATPRGVAKILLNCVVIALEGLIHGGTVQVTAPEDQKKLIVTAEGRGVGQRTDAWEPLRGDVPIDQLTPRSIHPHVTGCFARAFGVTIDVAQPGEDRLDLTLGYGA